ncbi:unnamed protein product [Sphenostylis stenocarpa]|uniref:Protein disulfide-isomerase n=1 Tax=Sphenostylis stenocarpa TaxID=92480 RepID=A0AA87BBA5_9FABA|nr:unnamed protein product [Sphenostylis stenocarpa]
MLPRKSLLLSLSLATLLLFSSLSLTLSNKPSLNDTKTNQDDNDDEDLSFLEEPHDAADTSHHAHFPDPDHFDNDDDDDFGDFSGFDSPSEEAFKEPAVDDKDVVILKERNFTTVIENNRFVMVEFYAPWCGHCQALAPEYAAAATELKPDGVVLAKVDATIENELAHEYDVQGFPTVFFFVDGEHKPYTGQRTKDAIVTWIKKKIGPGVSNITTLDEAERILTAESKVVLGFLNSLVGAESDELAAASKLEDGVNFYQTVVPDVAKLFHIDASVKRPALILLKKEEEKLNHFDGKFVKSEIAEFVSSNKLPLVTTFTRESAPEIFESQIKKQLLLFATSNDTEKFVPVFKESAKHFKGKLIFVLVEMDSEDVGKPVADYFGITGNGPKVLGYTGNDDGRKFLLDGEVTVDKLTAFGNDFLEEKLKPFLKSDPVPESNDGDVKIVVGNNFDEIVLDESKDVLLEIYAPWCGHCQALEPTYNKLAKHLRSIESIVIAKMDGTTNEHPRAKADGFPTLLFYPARNKSSDPIPVDVDRSVVAFYKFLRKHASIPFQLQNPATTSKPRSESSDVKESQSSSADVKDELIFHSLSLKSDMIEGTVLEVIKNPPILSHPEASPLINPLIIFCPHTFPDLTPIFRSVQNSSSFSLAHFHTFVFFRHRSFNFISDPTLFTTNSIRSMANPAPARFSALLLLLSLLVNTASATDSPTLPPELSPSSPPSHSPSPHVAPASHPSPAESPQSPSPTPNSNDSPPSPTPQNSHSPSPAPSPDGEDNDGVNRADLAGNSGKSSSGGMSSGKKAGVAVGVIVAAGVVVLGAFVYKKRRQNIQRSQYGYAARRELL